MPDFSDMNRSKVLKMWSFLHELVLSIKSKDLSANRFDYSSPGKLEYIRYFTPSIKLKNFFRKNDCAGKNRNDKARL